MNQSLAWKQIRLLEPLTPELAAEVLHRSTPVRFAPGDLLLRTGEVPEEVFLILRGEVEVVHAGLDGRRQTLARFGAGEMVGERALLCRQLRTADVLATLELEALRLPGEDFLWLIRETPAGLSLSTHLAEMLGNWTQRMDRREQETREMLTNLVAWQILPEFESFPGSTPWALELNERLRSLGPGRDPVLIYGEPGTWKELVARLIHRHCGNALRPIFHLDCLEPPPVLRGLLPGNLSSLGPRGGSQLASLFGHKPDDLLYARGSARGYLELSSGGDLILENVEELHPQVQELLLKALREKVFFRVGESEARSLELRIIATTDSDLRSLVDQGRFSLELYGLLSGQRVELRCLRERRKDIPEIARSLLGPLNRKHHKGVRQISQGAMNKLVDYDWPLNGQELQMTLDRAVALCHGEQVEEGDVALDLRRTEAAGRFNLMELPGLEQGIKATALPGVLRFLSAPIFLLILAACFWLPESGNPGNAAVWTLWWPSLLVLVLLFSRIWCSFCPLMTLGSWSAALRKRFLPLPALLRSQGVLLSSLGIFALLLIEQASGMMQAPRATGMLLTSLLAGALICHQLYGQRVWCRFICPLGRFLGQMTKLSLLKLRSTPSVCLSQCRTDACVRDGHCPMELHPAAADHGGQCILCLECVRSCPHRAIRLDLRLPWQGLMAPRHLRSREVYLVLALLAFLPAMMMGERVALQEQKIAMVLGVFIVLICCFFVLVSGREKLAGRRFAIACVPLVFSGFCVFYGDMAMASAQEMLRLQGPGLLAPEVLTTAEVLLRLSGAVFPLAVTGTGLLIALISLKKLWAQTVQPVPVAQILGLLLAAASLLLA